MVFVEATQTGLAHPKNNNNNISRCQKLFKVKDRVKDSVCILSVNLCEIYFNGLCHLANSNNIVFCQSPPLTDFTKESKALGYYHLKGDNITICSFWVETLCQGQKNSEANFCFPRKKWLYFRPKGEKQFFQRETNVLLRVFLTQA